MKKIIFGAASLALVALFSVLFFTSSAQAQLISCPPGLICTPATTTEACPAGFTCAPVGAAITASLNSGVRMDTARGVNSDGSSTGEAHLVATFDIKLKALDSDVIFGYPAVAFPAFLYKNGVKVDKFLSISSASSTVYAATAPEGATKYVGGVNGSLHLQKGKEVVLRVMYKFETYKGATLDLPQADYEVRIPRIIYGTNPATTGSIYWLDASTKNNTPINEACRGSYHKFSKNLTIGDTGEDVVRLQVILVHLKYLTLPPGVAYGYFGATTQTALNNYQKAVSIPVTGNLDVATREKIGDCVMPPYVPVLTTQSVIVDKSTIDSGTTANLKFGVPTGPIAAKLYLSCPAGVTSQFKSLNPINLCNTWYTFPKVPVNGESVAFSLNNTTTSDKSVVPNFYLYYPENPNFARGVSSQITVKPAAVAPAKATITVLGPNGGEVLDQSKTYTISWDYTGLESSDIINIGLRNSNENVCWIGKNSASARSHNFIPSQVKCSGDIVNLNSGGKFKAQVVVDKYANSIGVSDTSNNFFTISSAPTTSTNPTTPTTPTPSTPAKVSTLTLSPLSFTSIQTNNAIPLAWTTDTKGAQGIVVISLYKGGVHYKDLDSVETMGGSQSKSVFIDNSVAAGTYKVRVRYINQSTNDGPYAETSEFKITAAMQDASIWSIIKSYFTSNK